MAAVIEDKILVKTDSGRVRLVADFPEESYCIEVSNSATTEERQTIINMLSRFGLEIMHEDECPAEPYLGGTRFWCALIDGGA